ncbi:MAG: hypothetical protein JOZ51_28165, partial [Chloroflexi bacterium]|nr:hypothetical protein [Chloroflexota bacterium]
MTNSSGASDQAIPLPQGGGAMRGIGETFSPDLFTGTGNFRVPLSIPAGRNNFQPDLALVYSSGNGNGPYGLGWNLSIPGISRKTDKGIPRYDENDTFVLSGAEDLVPVGGNEGDGRRYRPRTEGLFAEIRHLRDDGNDYWRVKTKDGLIHLYGTPRPAAAPADWRDPAIIADADDPRRICTWQLTSSVDPFGNRIEYRYTTSPVEEPARRPNQLYLAEIRYLDYGPASAPSFLVRVAFAYSQRPDPFSHYRSGFELRTTLRCTQIAVTTQPGATQRVRTYHLDYLDQRGADVAGLPPNRVSLLSRVRVEGHDGEQSEWLPPLE